MIFPMVISRFGLSLMFQLHFYSRFSDDPVMHHVVTADLAMQASGPSEQCSACHRPVSFHNAFKGVDISVEGLLAFPGDNIEQYFC